MQSPNLDSAVASAIEGYPPAAKDMLLQLRAMIYRIADEDNAIGEISETTRWGEPSYLTHRPRSGTTIRLSWSAKRADNFAVSVHCQTRLVAEFREIYPELSYDGNRSIHIALNSPLPEKIVEHFVYLTLTYQGRK